MPVVTLAALDLDVDTRIGGSTDPTARPVVFVHGFLVDGRLWDSVARLVAEAGLRTHVPDWPLGAHRIPAGPQADLSPAGIARAVVAYLDALDLHDVILVGNDTGGAICQLALDLDTGRIGAVVLTNCDAFENFPPRAFLPVFWAARRPRVLQAMLQPARLRIFRHSPLGYGLLLRHPCDGELTRHWLEPALHDQRIRKDAARLSRGLDRQSLVELAPRLKRFIGPVRVVWGVLDRCFTLDTARRLVEAFDDAELIEVPDATTFVPIDRPQAVPDVIVDIAQDFAPDAAGPSGRTAGPR